jgi:arylsulfatase A-like enzyme
VNLAGGSLKQRHPLDGRDAWATITQGKPSPHEAILLNTTPANGAIRMGDWNLVLNGRVDANDLEAVGAKNAAPKKKKNAADKTGAGGVELFNLASDPYEKTNLADANPAKVKELRARLDAFSREAVPPKAEGQPANYKVPRVWGETP